MKKRRLFFKILPQLYHNNAIIITGMRQVGKTTLMKQLFEAWEGCSVWFDLNNPLDHLVFENTDYNAIYEELRVGAGAGHTERFLVCIDEIQNFPEITRIIKYLIDNFGVKFIVTSSSNFNLPNFFPESLNDRKFLYVLPVLSYSEFLYFRTRLSSMEVDLDEVVSINNKARALRHMDLYDEYLEFGGFPEVVLTENTQTRRMILKNIFASFFEKDINVFSEVKDVRELRDLILLLAPRNGNIIDVTRLASELGVNRVKVYNYLEFLEGAFILRLLPKYSSSIYRNVAGGKKVFFSDTGILNLVGRVSSGQILKVAVANQLLNFGQLSFYSKRNSSTIDFIMDGRIAFEIKNKAIASDQVKLGKKASNLGIEKHYVISKTPVDLPGVVYPWLL